MEDEGEFTTYEFHQALRSLREKGVIERNGDTYSFCIKPENSTENKYSKDIIDLINELINSEQSGKKDKRIGLMIQGCLDKGMITPEDYQKIGERTKMNTDMSFAKLLGIVEPLGDGNYRINNEIKLSLDNIGISIRNSLTEMYGIFGESTFSPEMVIAELNYSSSHANATLHKLTRLKVLNCSIDENKRYTYQFAVTPEDHPVFFVKAA